MTRFTTITASLLLAAAMLHGCLAAQLRQPVMRMCAEAQANVEHCKRGTCSNASMRNTHGEEWATVEELETDAEQDCALYEAVKAGRR